MPEVAAPAAIRLDKWLWQARFCKSRAVAARLVADGAVRVNAVRVSKPAHAVRVGDGLSFAQGGTVRAIRILAIGSRRGPAPEARALYADVGPGLVWLTVITWWKIGADFANLIFGEMKFIDQPFGRRSNWPLILIAAAMTR